MGSYKNYIKQLYHRQVDAGDAMAAWDRFEQNHLEEAPSKKKTYLWIIPVVLMASLSVYLLSINNITEIQSNQIVASDDTEDSTDNSHQSQETLTSNSEVVSSRDIRQPSTEKNISQTQNNRKEAVNRSSQRRNVVVSKKVDQVIPNKQSHSPEKSTLLTISSQQTDFFTKHTTETRKIDQSHEKIALVTQLPQIKTQLGYFIDQSIDSEIIKPRNSDLKVDRDFPLELGIYSGVNRLGHRFINNSNGANFGILVRYPLTRRLSINGQIGYSQLRLNSRVNSTDLRIDGIDLRKSNGNVSDIDKKMHQANATLELAFSFMQKRKLSAEIAGGLTLKSDRSEFSTYHLIGGAEDTYEVMTNSRYNYPLMYRFSSAVKYTFNDHVSLGIRPYFHRVLKSTQINHPYEMGVNGEIFYNF